MSRNVQSLERGLLVLEALVTNSPRGTTELADELGLDKTVIHRLLTTLQSMDYAEQDENRKYNVGRKLRQLGAQVLSNLDLRIMARPYMQQLTDFTHGVSHLAKMAEDRAIYIEKVQHPTLTLKATDVGGEAPGYCSAAGKVLWAHLSPSDLHTTVEKTSFRKHTHNTLTDVDELHEHLAQIRGQGFAMDYEEHRLGLMGVGAPVFDHMGNTIASICVAGYIDRVDDNMLEQIQSKVVNVAGQLSSEMGFPNGN